MGITIAEAIEPIIVQNPRKESIVIEAKQKVAILKTKFLQVVYFKTR